MSNFDSPEYKDFAGTIAGLPPEDMHERVGRAQALCEAAAKLGIEEGEEDIFLIAAMAHYQSNNKNPIAFHQRAKQIARWLNGPKASIEESEPRSRAMLERKVGELARLIAQRLFSWEGFVLLIFHDSAAPGFIAHASSTVRRSTIELLKQHLSVLSREQGRHS
jgi:hypothetical protein